MNDAVATPEAAPDGGATPPKFGTFTGVFLPTLLTIFGVIMYVRVGWSVGNAGLLGTWLVMLLAMGITTATGLSLSSIATNTRIGAGGPYAIMTHSLGLEVGGSIGLPLYLTRPLGVAMYIIGFREGWLWIFPDHPAIVIDLVVFATVTAVSYVSAEAAFRLQYVIFAIIVASLFSIFASPATFQPSAGDTVWWGAFPGFVEDGLKGTDFWGVFAVFFPATTGILAGANMSGDLKDPRRSIPRGTLWAIAISAAVYVALAAWCAHVATPDELVANYNVAIDKALWPPLVLAGLLGATASSALAGLVGGPRILMAMGKHRVIPGAESMAETGPDGNPRKAILVTAALTLACIMVRDLNVIAPIVTMFFLITYAMLNVVVLVEGGLGLVSFRPTLRIPAIVPLFGVAGCMFSMFIVQPTFGLLSLGLVAAFYLWLQRRVARMTVQQDDVRSSIFVAMAQWAAARVSETDQRNARAWSPNLLVPVVDPDVVRGDSDVLLDLTAPDGSVTLLGLEEVRDRAALLEQLRPLAERFRTAGVQSSAATVAAEDRVPAVHNALRALQAAFFQPNVLVIPFDDEPDGEDDALMLRYAETVAEIGVGMLIIAPHPRARFGQRQKVNLWVQPAPGSWDAVDAFSSGNLNLNLLTGYRLLRRWNAHVRVLTCIRDEADRERAARFLDELCDLARYPADVERIVHVGAFEDELRAAPLPDVTVIGVSPSPDPHAMRRWVQSARSACIFVHDSGRESALA